jgi:hypothetical protein
MNIEDIIRMAKDGGTTCWNYAIHECTHSALLRHH